jgi:tetratricopeptide (TPR) repeat protein
VAFLAKIFSQRFKNRMKIMNSKRKNSLTLFALFFALTMPIASLKAQEYGEEYVYDSYSRETPVEDLYELNNIESETYTGSNSNSGSAKHSTAKKIKAAPQLEQLYNESVDRFNEGNFKLALQSFTFILEQDPGFKDALLARGITYKKLGQLSASSADFSRLISLDPNNVEAYINRGVNRTQISENNLAMQDFSQALNLDPKNTLALTQRGNLKYSTKDYKGAIDDLTRVIALNEASPKAYFYRARANSALDQYSKAINDYNKAIFYQNKYPEAFYNRALAKVRMRDFASALQDAETAKTMYEAAPAGEALGKVEKLIQLIQEKIKEHHQE